MFSSPTSSQPPQLEALWFLEHKLSQRTGPQLILLQIAGMSKTSQWLVSKKGRTGQQWGWRPSLQWQLFPHKPLETLKDISLNSQSMGQYPFQGRRIWYKEPSQLLQATRICLDIRLCTIDYLLYGTDPSLCRLRSNMPLEAAATTKVILIINNKKSKQWIFWSYSIVIFFFLYSLHVLYS